MSGKESFIKFGRGKPATDKILFFRDLSLGLEAMSIDMVDLHPIIHQQLVSNLCLAGQLA